MRRIRGLYGWVFIVIIILGLIISGCGKKQAAVKSKEKVTLTFLCWGSTANMQIRKNVVAEFERTYPNIKIKTIHVPLNYEDKLQTMIAGGSAPDVFWLESTGQMASYASRGALLDLTKYANSDKEYQSRIKDYYEAALKSGFYNSCMFGLPWIYNPEALFYNKNIFAEAGLDVPSPEWTIDDLKKTAKKLAKDTTGDGKIDQYGFAGGDWTGFVWRFGGDIFDNNDNPQRCILDEAKSVAAFQFIQEVMWLQ